MTQFLVVYAPDASRSLSLVVDAVVRARDALHPRAPRHRIRGIGFEGCIEIGKEPADALWRSSDESLEIIATGTWFTPSGRIDSLASLGERIEREGVEDVARALEGPYALVVFDRRRHVVHVVTDIAGTMHVFIAKHGPFWAIGTSSSWLAALTGASLDPIAVREFLATGIVYEARTLWQGVQKLGQATVATMVPDGTVNERRYWSFTDIVPERDDLATSIVRLAHGMTGAARAIGERYSRVLCDITGGYDSRATIAAFIMADVPFSGTVSGPDDSRDVVISKAIAARFSIPHRHASAALRGDRQELDDATALTDGEYDATDYARVAAIHRRHALAYDISVNGSFGELARGYWWELLWPSIAAAEPLDNAMLARRRFAAAPYDKSIFADGAFDLVSHMRDVIGRVNEPLRGMPNTTLMDHTYFALRMHRWQGRIASSTARIWPNVSLFAFRSVLEPVLEARASSRIRSGLIRSLLARYLPVLANFPLEAGYPSAPARFSNIHRFWPIVPHYATRITKKIAPLALSGKRSTQPPASSPRLDLMPSEVDLLVSSGVFAPDALRSWLEWPSSSAQYSRLLTLGVLLTQLNSARRDRVAPSPDAMLSVAATGN